VRRLQFYMLMVFLCSSPFVPFVARQLREAIGSHVVVVLFWVIAASILYGLTLIALMNSTPRASGSTNILDAAIGLYALVIFVQMANGHLPSYQYALRGLFESGQWILAYILARFVISNHRRGGQFLTLVAVTVSLQALYGVLALWIGVERIDPLMIQLSTHAHALFTYRAVGMLGSPFSFGLLCAMGVVVALIRGASSSRATWRLAMALALLGSTAGVVASGSRTSMFAIGVAVLVWLGVGASRKRGLKCARKGRRRMLAYTVVSALFLLVLASAFLPMAGGSYYTRQMLTLADPLTVDSMVARFDMWGRLAPVILADPWGRGIGSLGNATYLYGEVVGLTVADNQYLEVAVETGVIGLTLLVAILAAACAYSLRLAASGSSLGLAALLACVAVIIAGIAGPPLKAFPANILFGCLLGAMSGEYSRWRRSRRESARAGAEA